MSSDPKPEDIKKTARNKAMQWYRRIENRVAPVVALGGLIVENTTRWVFEKRNQHYYTTYYEAKGFLTSPCQSVRDFLRAREIEALSSLWDLSWDPPKYNTGMPRRFVVTAVASPLNDRNAPSVTQRGGDDATPIPSVAPAVNVTDEE